MEDLLADKTHVIPLEAQELVFLRNCLQIYVLQTVFFHFKRLMHFTIDDTAFEVELAQFFLDFEEEVVHEQDVHFLDVLHLHCVDPVDLGDETLWIAPQMVQVLG